MPDIAETLNAIAAEVLDVYEETYELFSHDLPTSDLGMVDDKSVILRLDVAGHQYDIRQSPGLLTSSNAEGTTGAALWKITPLIAEWLQCGTNALWTLDILRQDAIVVELGCGITGLIGLVMAPRIDKYILTDQNSVMKPLQENIDANTRTTSSKIQSRTSKKRSTVTVVERRAIAAELNWETDGPSQLDRIINPTCAVDLLVVCDCVFNDFLLEPLVTMCELLCKRTADQKTVVLIAQQLRSDEVFAAFMTLLLRKFKVWRVNDSNLPEELHNGSGYATHLAMLR